MRAIILMLLMLFCACACDRSSVIDQDYLESTSYRSFKEKASREKDNTARERKEFIRFVKQQDCRCSKPQNSSGPLTVDTEDIIEALKKEPVENASMTSLFGQDQIYYYLSGVTSGSSCQSFFLTCKVGNYKSCLIWYATTQAGNLKQLHMLAAFKKTHTYKIVPQIRMESNQIIVEMQRSSIYPLQILSSNQVRYIKRPNGTISYAENN